MKRIIFLLALTLSTMTAFSQTAAKSSSNETVALVPTYQLYQTQNMWIYIKLNTQDGTMKLVQFSVDNVESIGEFKLNPNSLATGKDKKNGRFSLTPTDNMWTFLLLDQIDGDVWQGQWGFDETDRFVRKIE